MEKLTFGQFLAKKRKENNYTQKDMANALFVSESTISKWEKDVAEPDLFIIAKLSKLLNVTEHELISASEDSDTRNKMVQAKKWNNLKNTYDMFFFISYSVAILVCFICNIAVNKTLSWFFIVLSSILLSASFTTIPQFIKKERLIVIPLIELGSLILLLLVCNIYTRGNWLLVALFPIILFYIIIFLPITIANSKIFTKIKPFNAVISISVDFIILTLMLVFYNARFNGNWFGSLCAPFVIMGLLICFANILIAKCVKTNKSIKASIFIAFWDILLVFLPFAVKSILLKAGVPTEDAEIPNIFKADFSNWINDYISNNVFLIIFLSLLFASAICLLIGIIANKKSKKNI
ncbi:MAG: helix-turn-helix domain-containing protein [Clostridia bacterium]|nr:helix-turn-helix domain-containing protein [Clostridia bacterium]